MRASSIEDQKRLLLLALKIRRKSEMNNWEKEQLRKRGYSEVAIWEIEHHQ